MRLLSSAFENGKRIPSKYTCDGEDISPPLLIEDIDSRVESLALIVDDPDAPGKVFVHWVIWNIPSDFKLIQKGISNDERVNSLGGAVQGENDFGSIGYRGPCPPDGPAHRYRFKSYALDTMIELDPGSTNKDLMNRIKDHIIDEVGLTGKYAR